jgi:putative phage-type endonuclease
MRIIKDIEQGSKEWLDLRMGVITASRIKDLMTKARGDGLSITAQSYMYELLAESLTGESKPFFENEAMRWGTETEPQARAMYEIRNNVEVEQVAFVMSTTSARFGVSPDGLVGDKGLVEIKCPTTITQLKRSQQKDPSCDYKAQIQCQLLVTGRKWCDFVSFDPRLDVGAGYIQHRVYRDDIYISEMNDKVIKFLVEMQKIHSNLTEE